MGGEVLAELELELVDARLLGRHREREPALLGLLGDRAAELLVDQHARRLGIETGRDGLLDAFIDQLLRVGDRGGFVGRGVALDPEHLLLERPSVIEGQDVQLPVVTEGHLRLLLFGD